MSNDLVHLHVHSMGSLLDGFPTAQEVVERARALGHDSIAVTDHGSMANLLQFYLAAKEAGVKPLLGVEGYLANGSRHDREKDQAIFHIGLIAQNYKGYQNLCKISEIAWNEGFYKKPRFDFETLSKYSDGVIALSGCMDGPVSHFLRHGDYDQAIHNLEKLISIFGDKLFIEIQPWNPEGLNKDLIELSEQFSLSLVATADAHFCTQEDILAEEVALLINQSTEMKVKDKDAVKQMFKASRENYHSAMARIDFLYPHRKLSFAKINNYLMSRRNLELRMLDAGYDVPEAYDNTIKVADMVENFEIPLHQNYLPKYLRHQNSDEYLTELAFDKLADKGLRENPEYLERLIEELAVIKTLGFSDYMLIVWDMCNWAHSNGIYLGPGRGSVAGSLLAYVLGITRVDPIQHGLLFWRFLNVDESGKSGRIDPPDIDTDVEDIRRDEVKNYLADRWKHVASISATTKFSSKGMVRDISRVFAIPLDEVNAVCKHFDSLEDYLTSEKTQAFRAKYPEIGELGKKFEGRWRFLGVHAAGVVVADRPLNEIIPLESRSAGAGKNKGRIRTTAFDMDDVQLLGLLKLDALGLKSLTVVHDTLKLIKERHGIELDIDTVSLDDPRVLNEFTVGHTVGAFQVDTQSYTRLLKDMRVDSFLDLMASNALVRPGPLLTVTPQYIARKHGTEEIPKEHPAMAAFTKETYGLIIYQEQLMQALVDIGGFSQAEADKVRKIIGKKRDPEEFKPFEEKWVEGATEILGATRAKKLWKDFLKFAGYAFNKSHSCAYSILSYQTMWLKVYYPIEFLTALMKNENDNSKITTFIFEAQRMGIEVLPPDINTSRESFSIERDGVIRFGLGNVHGVGEMAVQEVMEHRPYTDMDDFLGKIRRRRCNQRVINNLVNCGAFRSIHETDIDYSQYSYELLGVSDDIGSGGAEELGIDFSPAEECGDETLRVIKALVKKVVRRPEWSRIEVEDESGSAAFFTRSDYDIEEGKIVIAVVYAQDWVGHSYLESFEERVKNNGELNDIEKFMLGQVFTDEKVLYNRGIGGFESDKCLLMPLHVRVFKTKSGQSKGKNMAIIIATDGEETGRVVIFPKNYAQCASWVKPFTPIVIKKSVMKDGTISIVDDGLRLANTLMEMSKIG